MEITYNVNPEKSPIPTKQMNGVYNESFYVSRLGDLLPTVKETVLETTKPTVIDLLDFANNSNTNSVQLYIQYYTGSEYVDIGFLNADGSASTQMTTRNIVDNGVEIFNVKVFDTTNNKFKFSLNQKLYFPKGVKIQVHNKLTETTVKAGLRIYGRYA